MGLSLLDVSTLDVSTVAGSDAADRKHWLLSQPLDLARHHLQ
jgi:hypothetical protein